MNEEEEYPVVIFDYMGIDINEDPNIKDSVQFWGSLVFGSILWTAANWAILAIVGLL